MCLVSIILTIMENIILKAIIFASIMVHTCNAFKEVETKTLVPICKRVCMQVIFCADFLVLFFTPRAMATHTHTHTYLM